jgi:hypothetical protein
MRPRILPLLAFCSLLFSENVRAQVVDSNAHWTWMSGNQGLLDRGTVPPFNSPAVTHRPPARFNPMGWTDNAGNLWLFGGDYNNGNNAGLIGNNLNDLWKYNVTTNEWTLVRGLVSPTTNAGFNVPGVYGTLGVTAAGNQPGGRRGGLPGRMLPVISGCLADTEV